MVSRHERRLMRNNPYYVAPAKEYLAYMRARAKAGYKMKRNYVPIIFPKKKVRSEKYYDDVFVNY